MEKEEFNKESVFYCVHCLSLAIKQIQGLDFCDNCGSTAIADANIKEWEEMYMKRYGKKFINK